MTPRRTGDIEYMLLRSGSRRTADIVIERDGKISVRVPRHLAVEQVDQLIDAKRYWIYKNLAEWRDLNATRVVRELRNGEGFMYLGSSYRLSLIARQQEPLVLKDGRLRLRRDLVEKEDVSAVQSAFKEYYVARGLERIEKRVNYYAPKVGVSTKTVIVKNLGYRWASCGTDGKLSFHWKCIMAPPKIIDYIVVHELCHLHHRDHTEVFWNEVDKVMPDYYERKAWLKANGAALDL